MAGLSEEAALVGATSTVDMAAAKQGTAAVSATGASSQESAAGAVRIEAGATLSAEAAVAQGIDELEQAQGAFDSQNVGLGVDIVEIDRMRRILGRSKTFAQKVFSADEQAYCNSTASPETHYALRFAAKEAVLKALGTGFSKGIGVRDVEVRRNAKGRPVAVLYGAAKKAAEAQGVRDLPLSLSYTHTEAVACAMAITEGSRRASEERKDPKEELVRKFKETRSILDEL